MNRGLWFAGLVGCVLTVAGCGQSGPSKLDVSGTVKFDGQDVTDGYITFVPEDKTVGPEAGPIKDGKYTAQVREGKNKVKIQATRPVPGKKGPMGEQAVEQYIPKQYNEETTLSADVARGKTEHNFDLKK
jgi:hypothetical protein